MATRRKKQPEPWKGDEVQEDGRGPGEAERAADRAEGKTPLTAADAADRAHDEDDEEVDLPRASPTACRPRSESPRSPRSILGDLGDSLLGRQPVGRAPGKVDLIVVLVVRPVGGVGRGERGLALGAIGGALGFAGASAVPLDLVALPRFGLLLPSCCHERNLPTDGGRARCATTWTVWRSGGPDFG